MDGGGTLICFFEWMSWELRGYSQGKCHVGTFAAFAGWSMLLGERYSIGTNAPGYGAVLLWQSMSAWKEKQELGFHHACYK